MPNTHFAPMPTVLACLSLFLVFSNAFSIPLNLLSPRQQQAIQATCDHYSTIANLSVVGANATYRAAYLKASPEGSDPARAPLDSAELELPKLQFDKTLNQECGNLTTIAFTTAATNFTEGRVLQFNINSARQLGASSLGLAMVMILIVVGLNDLL